MTSPSIVNSILDSVIHIADFKHALDKLGKACFCENIIVCYTQYLNNPSIVLNILKIISKLGLHLPNLKRFAETNVCELIQQTLLKRKLMKDIVIESFHCIIVLTNVKSVQIKFGNIGICEQVIELIDMYIKNVVIAECGPITLRCLIYRNSLNRKRVLVAKGEELMEKINKLWTTDKDGVKARYEARDLINQFHAYMIEEYCNIL